MNIPKKVKIRRVPKAGYFNIVAYPKSVTVLSCQLTKGGYNTGLTKEEEKFFEEKLDLKPGTLGKSSKWWGEVFNVDYPIRLNNNKTNEIITEDNWINQLTYKVLLAHSDVANSELEKNNAGVIFYIDDEEVKAKKQIEVINFELEGMKVIFGMSLDKQKSTLRLFGIKGGIDELPESTIQAYLFTELKKDPKLFMEIVKDKDLEIKALIEELVEKNMLQRGKNASYIYNEETIAPGIKECVQYFKDNQDVKLALMTKLKGINKKVKV